MNTKYDNLSKLIENFQMPPNVRMYNTSGEYIGNKSEEELRKQDAINKNKKLDYNPNDKADCRRKAREIIAKSDAEARRRRMAGR